MNRMTDAGHHRAVINGRRSKAAGEYWEKIIEAACIHYHNTGQAEIAKTPEPMRPIKSLGGGKFIAYYEKMAQPDYKGTLYGGKAIVFEAKHTDGDRLNQSVISSEQEKQLDRHAALGAECFVMVSFRFEEFFKIPWEVFRNMKQHYGRKYITPKDVQEYRVKLAGGILRIL
ncbi:MAG: Holliday junction resolvase RecU [Ruminococcus sp.]|nr:Holliday junction resolvase RecU [Ruminococcus sp.]